MLISTNVKFPGKARAQQTHAALNSLAWAHWCRDRDASQAQHSHCAFFCPPPKGWARGNVSLFFPPFHCFPWERSGFCLLWVGWFISCTYMREKSMKNIYLCPVGQLRYEVWWIDQHAWRYRRPLNNYPGRDESLTHPAKLSSPSHFLFLQKKTPQKIFQSS